MDIKKILKQDFIKSVAVLMTGTVLSQIIAFAVSPILTRIYTPEEMGDLNVYIRVVSFLSAFATARFELSLPLPKKEEHSFLLYKLSFRIAKYILFAVSIFFVIYTFIGQFNWFKVVFAISAVLGTLALVVTNLGTNWAIRNKEFKRISNNRVTSSFVSNGLRWVFGLMNWGSFGLVIATVIGYLISSLGFFREYLKIDKFYKSYASKKKTHVLLKTYKEFPTINLPHVMVDLGKDLLLAFLIILFFNKEIFAWFSHSMTILQLPIGIIGMSIGQVFFNRAAQKVNDKESTLPLLKRTVLSLFFLCILPFSLLFFFGSEMFDFVFGDNWATAGYYSEIMTVWFFMNFLNSAVSSLPTILNRQKEFFVLGIISSFIQLFGFGVLPLILGKTPESFVQILWIVSSVQAIFFLYTLAVMFRFASLGVKEKTLSSRKSQ